MEETRKLVDLYKEEQEVSRGEQLENEHKDEEKAVKVDLAEKYCSRCKCPSKVDLSKTRNCIIKLITNKIQGLLNHSTNRKQV